MNDLVGKLILGSYCAIDFFSKKKSVKTRQPENHKLAKRKQKQTNKQTIGAFC